MNATGSLFYSIPKHNSRKRNRERERERERERVKERWQLLRPTEEAPAVALSGAARSRREVISSCASIMHGARAARVGPSRTAAAPEPGALSSRRGARFRSVSTQLRKSNDTEAAASGMRMEEQATTQSDASQAASGPRFIQMSAGRMPDSATRRRCSAVSLPRASRRVIRATRKKKTLFVRSA